LNVFVVLGFVDVFNKCFVGFNVVVVRIVFVLVIFSFNVFVVVVVLVHIPQV